MAQVSEEKAQSTNTNTNTNPNTRAEGPIICPGHSRGVPDVAYTNETPDGYFLISSCLDNKAMLRDGATGDWIGTFIGHKGAVWCARMNAAATQAVTASADFSAKLWDALSGECLHTFAHRHVVKSCIFSQDSTHLYTGGHEKKLRVFDLHKPEAAPQIWEGHTNAISHIIEPADSNLILSAGSAEKDVKIWDRRTSSIARTISSSSPLTSLTITLDRSVITTTSGHDIHFYDADTFNLIKSFHLPREIEAVAYHATTKKFVTTSNSEIWVRAYDFTTGEEIAVNKGHHGSVRCLAMNPSGSAYASGSDDATIRIWEWARNDDTKSTSTSTCTSTTASTSQPSSSPHSRQGVVT